MDTEYDFFTPEFLNILFFQQKNLVIFPYVDLKHLRSLQVFAVGHDVVDLDSAAIHNLNEIIEFEASSYSQQPTFYFVLNPKTEEIEKLINSTKVRCVVNTREIVESLANGTRFVFYNKKSKTFVNYEPEKQDLSFEKHLIRSYPDKQLLLDEMIRIKSIATKIYLQLNENSNPDNLPKLLRDYNQIYWDKILDFTRLYYDIEIPNFDRPKQLPGRDANSEPEEEKDFSNEYEIIMKVNRKIGQKFIQLIHNYRFDKVNPANLEVPQLFYPKMLYNYLRNHHWEKGIPQEFVSKWIRATADFSLTEDDHMEFQMVLNKLDLPYPLPQFDAERGSEPATVSSSHFKRENPIQAIRKEEEGHKTVPSPVKKVKQIKQIESVPIPPIGNFREFRGWVLKKLDELENISK
ncbi:MAG: hypothetical protein CEE42_09165 [Promethearchaeota archaeon Loki_b31]|nr:MAG: hypothetical protein CEE42_09165 [Candidatus Lokiarchaeota archaeon Loki_b31]